MTLLRQLTTLNDICRLKHRLKLIIRYCSSKFYDQKFQCQSFLSAALILRYGPKMNLKSYLGAKMWHKFCTLGEGGLGLLICCSWRLTHFCSKMLGITCFYRQDYLLVRLFAKKRDQWYKFQERDLLTSAVDLNQLIY